jgi:hypothetical protein
MRARRVINSSSGLWGEEKAGSGTGVASFQWDSRSAQLGLLAVISSI